MNAGQASNMHQPFGICNRVHYTSKRLIPSVPVAARLPVPYLWYSLKMSGHHLRNEPYFLSASPFLHHSSAAHPAGLHWSPFLLLLGAPLFNNDVDILKLLITTSWIRDMTGGVNFNMLSHQFFDFHRRPERQKCSCDSSG